MIIEIKQFIKIGKFGPVEIGMPKDKVLELLGPPDGEISCGKPTTGIHYSYYEFFFDPNKNLKGIQNDNYNPAYPENVEFKNDIFEIDPWFLRSEHRIHPARGASVYGPCDHKPGVRS